MLEKAERALVFLTRLASLACTASFAESQPRPQLTTCMGASSRILLELLLNKIQGGEENKFYCCYHNLWWICSFSPCIPPSILWEQNTSSGGKPFCIPLVRLILSNLTLLISRVHD